MQTGFDVQIGGGEQLLLKNHFKHPLLHYDLSEE